MDPELSAGLVLTAVGLATVFVALVTLVGMLGLLRRVAGALDARGKAGAGGGESSGSGPTVSADANPGPAGDGELLHVALAAYALHQRRRAPRARRPAPVSSWTQAGRAAAALRFPTRR